MKNFKNKDNSISDLVNEFHVSKSSIELYGIHRLLLPIPDKKSKPAFRPLDKARLKFIAKAKNADYTIGNIKDLIGVLDLGKNEVDQIEESLVYGKKKAAALTDTLEDLDALEQINATCDLELLEAYITDLNNLKYGLDIAPIKTALPDPDTEPIYTKPRTLLYSHVADQITAAAPAIEPKKSQRPLVVVAGILLVAISGYLYLGGDPVPDIAKNPETPLQIEPAEMTTATAASNEADEIYLSETDTNPDESVGTLANEPDSREDSFLPLDFPTLKNELNSPSADPMESRLETYSDEQTQDTETTQALLDAINEPRAKTPKPVTPEKESSADAFFKQLVADLKIKYDEQAQSQKPATNDTVGLNATPEKKSERKETQNLAVVTVPNDDPQANKTTSAGKVLKETKSKSTAATTKTSLKKTTTAPPITVAPLSVTQRPPSTNAGVKPPSTKSPKSSSSVVSIKNSIKKATVPTKKIETTKLQTSDESVNQAITPPKPKPKVIPQKPANPEALKWVQKSYESVMSGNAGEAIITASVALTLDPGMVNAYINRSWAYSKKGQYDKAIQDCDKALDIDTDNALAYNNRGLAFQGKGDMDKAKADYERACTLGFDIGCKNYQEIINLVTK
ncbi:tetratricopeptide repeat protein [Thermodesulfobacteriota bacterium]